MIHAEKHRERQEFLLTEQKDMVGDGLAWPDLFVAV